MEADCCFLQSDALNYMVIRKEPQLCQLVHHNGLWTLRNSSAIAVQNILVLASVAWVAFLRLNTKVAVFLNLTLRCRLVVQMQVEARTVPYVMVGREEIVYP